MRCIIITTLSCLLCASALAQKSNHKPAFTSATLQALNKVTARVSELSTSPNLPTQFGTISIHVKSCWTSPRDEKPEHAALIEIREEKAGFTRAETIFSGWMFASSPALSALEHPVYDIALIRCEK